MKLSRLWSITANYPACLDRKHIFNCTLKTTLNVVLSSAVGTSLKVRQNDEMPRYLRPYSSLPRDIGVAIESMGTIFSRAIVRHLSVHGETGSAELAEALGTDPNTVRRCLKQLEEAGIVTASIPEGQRRGRAVLFSSDPEQIELLMKSLGDFLLGH